MYAIIDDVAIGTDTLTTDALESLIARGAKLFGSMVGAVYYGGVVATPFERPVRQEVLYDGAKALGLDGERRMVETGRRAAYQVHVLGRSFGIDAARAVHDPVAGNLPADPRLIAR